MQPKVPGIAGIIEEQGHFNPIICPIEFYTEKNGCLVRAYLDLNGSAGYLKLTLKAAQNAWYSWEN